MLESHMGEEVHLPDTLHTPDVLLLNGEDIFLYQVSYQFGHVVPAHIDGFSYAVLGDLFRCGRIVTELVVIQEMDDHLLFGGDQVFSVGATHNHLIPLLGKKIIAAIVACSNRFYIRKESNSHLSLER